MKNLYKIKDKLYVVSNNEGISENCWIITGGRLVQVSYLLSDEVAKGFKVILTTDDLLIKDGLQKIDDEFLEWFVKNPSCEEVETIYDFFNPMGRKVNPCDVFQNQSQCVLKYKIIIPNEKQKEHEEQKELRRKLLNLIKNLEEDELLELSKEKSISYEEFRVKASEALLYEFDSDCLKYSEDKDSEKYFYGDCKYWEGKLEEESKQECCQNVSGFYLGTTCPKCNQPFRSVIDKPKEVIFVEENFTLMDKELIKEAKKVWKELSPNPIEMALFGADWQAKRSFSEEEVDVLIHELINKFTDWSGSYVYNDKLIEIYKQLKKK